MPESETKMLPWMVSGVFGQPPEQSLQQAIFLAPNRELAIAMFVSASHTQQGVTGMLMAIAIDEIRQDILEAARRGMTGPAPVLAMVPKEESALATEPTPHECRHNQYYQNCTCDSASCVLLRSASNPQGLEAFSPRLGKLDENHRITGHIFRPRADGHCLLCGVNKDDHVHVYDEPQPAG